MGIFAPFVATVMPPLLYILLLPSHTLHTLALFGSSVLLYYHVEKT